MKLFLMIMILASAVIAEAPHAPSVTVYYTIYDSRPIQTTVRADNIADAVYKVRGRGVVVLCASMDVFTCER